MCIRDSNQTTTEASAQPKVAPANVLVSPLGTGRNTSAVRADITTMDVYNLLSDAQLNAVSP